MGKAIGALLGGAAGLSAGPLVVAALIPGVGRSLVVCWQEHLPGAAGEGIGAVAGEKRKTP